MRRCVAVRLVPRQVSSLAVPHLHVRGLRMTVPELAMTRTSHDVWLPSDATEFQRWIDHEDLLTPTSEPHYIGFDTESKPAFIRDGDNRTALVQMTGRRSTVLLQVRVSAQTLQDRILTHDTVAPLWRSFPYAFAQPSSAAMDRAGWRWREARREGTAL
jgi:hypothetical protein